MGVTWEKGNRQSGSILKYMKEPHDSDERELQLLRVINESGHLGMTMRDLKRASVLTEQWVSFFLQRIEADGLVQLTGTRVVVTEEGKLRLSQKTLDGMTKKS